LKTPLDKKIQNRQIKDNIVKLYFQKTYFLFGKNCLVVMRLTSVMLSFGGVQKFFEMIFMKSQDHVYGISIFPPTLHRRTF